MATVEEPFAIFSHDTALELIRSGSFDEILCTGERVGAPIPLFPPDRAVFDHRLRDVKQLADSDGPAHLLVSSSVGGKSNMTLRTRICRAQLPETSFFVMSSDLLCTAPEQLLVQLSPSYTRLELTLRMCELMGYYSIRPDDDFHIDRRSCCLTDPQLIEQHLEALGAMRGIPKVREALYSSHPESSSPLESKLYLRLGLKCAFGGYGLPVLGLDEPNHADCLGFGAGGPQKPAILMRSRDGSYVGVDLYEGNERDKGDYYERRSLIMAEHSVRYYLIDQEVYDEQDEMDDFAATLARALGEPPKHLSAAQEQRAYLERQTLYDQLDSIDRPAYGVNTQDWRRFDWRYPA